MQLKQNIEQFLLHYDVMVPLTPPKPPRAPGLPTTPASPSPLRSILPNPTYFGLSEADTTKLRNDLQIHLAVKMPQLLTVKTLTAADQQMFQKITQERMIALFSSPSHPSSPPSPIFPRFNIPTSPSSSPAGKKRPEELYAGDFF